MLNVASKVTFASPFLARFVVMIITPFAACAPYIEADAASFRTCIDSTSLLLIIVPGLSRVITPSITYNGPLASLRNEEAPLIDVLVLRPPGVPSVVIVMPGTRPCNDCRTFPVGVSDTSFIFTTDTEPVKSDFFSAE